MSIGFYETDAWRKVRYEALKLHGGSCQCCGRKPQECGPLHVDHIKPRSRYPHLELELSNLQVLCKDCNFGKGAWDQTDWRPLQSQIEADAAEFIQRMETRRIERKQDAILYPIPIYINYIARPSVQSRAHIVSNGDTLCKAYSTGALNIRKYDFLTSLHGHPVCHTCERIALRQIPNARREAIEILLAAGEIDQSEYESRMRDCLSGIEHRGKQGNAEPGGSAELQ